MQKKEMDSTKKKIGMQAAVTMSLISLAVGFLGGIVFSAFKMESSLPAMSGMVAAESQEETTSVTDEEEKKVAALEKAAESAPEDADAWIALGNACFDYNLNQKAIDAYETALKISPGNADVCTDLGTVYRRNGDSQKAVSMYEMAQKISPGHEMSLLNEGIVYLHDMNDAEGAIEAWEKLLQVNPAAATSGGMMIKNLVETLKSQL